MADSHHGSSSSRARVSSSHSADRDFVEREKPRDGNRYRDRDRSRDERDNPPRPSLQTSERALHSRFSRVSEKPSDSEKSRVSSSSSDDSLYSGSPHSGNNSFEGKDAEREPGELSSGSLPDDTIALEVGKSSKRSSRSAYDGSVADTDASHGSPTLKKRKFTPIIWDLDDRHSQKGSGVAGGLSSSLSKMGSSTKAQSRPSPGVATPPLPPPPPSILPSPPLPPPPPLSFSLKSPHQRTPSASVPRETPPKSSSRPSSTPPSAARNSSVARALSSSVPKPVGGSSDTKKTTSQTAYMGSPPSLEHPSFSPTDVDSTAERTQRDARASNRSPLSSEYSDEGQLSGSPMQDDDVYMAPAPRNIAASRWAEESTPPSEGKFVPGKAKFQQSMSAESDERGRLSPDEEEGRDGTTPNMSPEPGEYIKEKSEMVSEGTGGSSTRKENDGDQYERDLNDRELMELDKDTDHDSEEEHPEVDSEEEEQVAAQVAPPVRIINMLQGCRSVDEFERLNKIDEGTYGVVYRARNKKTGEIVALKKVKMEKEREGFPMTSLREINVLLSIHHPSIVDVKEVVVGSNLDSIFMVMEYMEHDLKGLMETIKQPFSQSEVKCLMLQLFEGVKHLHDNWVLHRFLSFLFLVYNLHIYLEVVEDFCWFDYMGSFEFPV